MIIIWNYMYTKCLELVAQLLHLLSSTGLVTKGLRAIGTHNNVATLAILRYV